MVKGIVLQRVLILDSLKAIDVQLSMKRSEFRMLKILWEDKSFENMGLVDKERHSMRLPGHNRRKPELVCPVQDMMKLEWKSELEGRITNKMRLRCSKE